jgi:formiminotetrahydrofolate cyclodeaminase
MKLIDLSLNQFIEEVDSLSPAPGGGSVAALSGAIGAALVRMVGHFSVSKKKFLTLPSENQAVFNEAVGALQKVKERLEELIDVDTDSYNRIVSVLKLPKETPSQIEERNRLLQEATLGAIRVPFEVASLCLRALMSLEPILQFGNKNTFSDLGVGTLMFYAGLEGAILNVKINLSGINDENAVKKYRESIAEIMSEGVACKTKILCEIHQLLG